MVCWEFFNWPKEEQELAVGEYLNYDNRQYLVIQLDEYNARCFGTEYTTVSVFYLLSSRGVQDIRVHVPSVDDYALFADFKITTDINLSTLTELIFNYCKRTQFKYININALADYCRYLGAYNIDLS